MNLLAANAWALDVAFFAIIFIGILAGVATGFLRCVTKIVGLILSGILAASFCVAFKNNLESWFGLQTALANATGSGLIASILSTVISFIALYIVIFLLAWFIGHVGTSIVDKSKVMASVNHVLGGLMGGVMAAALIFLLLAIMFWINVEAANSFISDSTVVGAIYNWDYFRYAARFSFL